MRRRSTRRRRQKPQTVELKEVAGRLSEFAAQIAQGLAAADFLQRRQIVRALVARVEFDEQGATVVYRIPALRSDGSTQAPVAPSGSADLSPESHQLGWRRTEAAMGVKFPETAAWCLAHRPLKCWATTTRRPVWLETRRRELKVRVML